MGTLQDGDLVVALGGDGTVLAALRAAALGNAPVLGIACGSLGALSAVTADQIDDALERVWAGELDRAIAARVGDRCRGRA